MRVGQAVTEREQRLLALGRVPAIAGIGAFLIGDREDRRRTTGAAGVGGRVVRLDRGEIDRRGARRLRFGRREGERQVARGVHLAEQDVSNRLTTALPRIPGGEHRRHLLQPRHQHRAAALQHHRRLRVGRGHRVDQTILMIGQGEGFDVLGLGAPLGGEDDGDIGRLGGGGRRDRIAAVDIADGRARHHRLDRLKRRRAVPRRAREGGRRAALQRDLDRHAADRTHL